MKSKTIWFLAVITAITLLLQYISLSFDESPFMYCREDFIANIYWQWILPSLVHENWVHWFFNVANLVAILVLFDKVWTVKKVSILFASSSLFIILSVHLFSKDFSHYLGMSGVLYTLAIYGAVKSIKEYKVISTLVLLYVLLKLIAHDWVNHIMGVDTMLGELTVLTDVHWYGAAFGIIWLMGEMFVFKEFKALPKNLQNEPVQRTNYFLSPMNENWIDSLLHWRETYDLNIPGNADAIKDLKALIVENNDMERLPKGIVHLVKLKKVVLLNNKNMILSALQKRWLKYLEKQGCELVIDDELLKKTTVTQSNKKVQCKAYVDKLLETRRSFKYKILLRDVFVEDTYFRDHTFVKISKHWAHIREGDYVKFTAKESIYYHKGKKKKGFRHIRNVQIL